MISKIDSVETVEPRFRLATSQDAQTIVTLIKELAAYEGEPNAVKLSAEVLAQQLGTTSPPCECLLALVGNTIVGFGLFYQGYSTYEGAQTMHLEDLYISPAHRKSGIGRKMFSQLSQMCRVRGYRRLEWRVTKDNLDAISFYRSLGAMELDDLTTFRLDVDALKALG